MKSWMPDDTFPACDFTLDGDERAIVVTIRILHPQTGEVRQICPLMLTPQLAASLYEQLGRALSVMTNPSSGAKN